MKKIVKRNIIWIINSLLLISVVLLGIEQGGFGAEMSQLNKNIDKEIITKRIISENIYKGQEIKDEDKIMELGFNKPKITLYFDIEEAVAKLPVQ